MDDRAEFLDSLNALMQTAELNGNLITAKDMDDCFGKLKINDGQQSMIYNFPQGKHIRVQTDEKAMMMAVTMECQKHLLMKCLMQIMMDKT